MLKFRPSPVLCMKVLRECCSLDGEVKSESMLYNIKTGNNLTSWRKSHSLPNISKCVTQLIIKKKCNSWLLIGNYSSAKYLFYYLKWHQLSSVKISWACTCQQFLWVSLSFAALKPLMWVTCEVLITSEFLTSVSPKGEFQLGHRLNQAFQVFSLLWFGAIQKRWIALKNMYPQLCSYDFRHVL